MERLPLTTQPNQPGSLHRQRGGHPIPRKPDVDREALEAVLNRAFNSSTIPSYERTREGVSTQVYRITHDRQTFYLRIAEEREDNLATEALVHTKLRHLGVRVPEVIFVEEFDDALERSVMVTRQMPGVAAIYPDLNGIPEDVYREAGRDVAVINSIRVDGFGWVVDEPVWPPRAEYPTYAEFVVSNRLYPWPGRLELAFDADDLYGLQAIITAERMRDLDRGYLVHGDFDSTHIFVRDGKYSGMIDLGEIRGAESYFDLALLFLLREAYIPNYFEALLEGYSEITPLSADYKEQIRRSAILLGLRQLCRWLSPERGLSPHEEPITGRAAQLRELLLRRRRWWQTAV